MKIIRETLAVETGTITRLYYEDANGDECPLDALPDGAELMSSGDFNSPIAYAAWREVFWLDD